MISPTKLIRNVRNPKFLSNWLEVWTAKIEDADNYTISPSSHWKFPIDQIVDDEGNNISWDNIFEDLPIMTQENAGIAKAGTGLSMNDSTVNVAINTENAKDIFSENFPLSAINSNTTVVGSLDESNPDPNALVISNNTINVNNLTEDLQDIIEEITVNRINTKLFGVGIGTAVSPEAVDVTNWSPEEIDQWRNSDMSKCGIWIQI